VPLLFSLPLLHSTPYLPSHWFLLHACHHAPTCPPHADGLPCHRCGTGTLSRRDPCLPATPHLMPTLPPPALPATHHSHTCHHHLLPATLAAAPDWGWTHNAPHCAICQALPLRTPHHLPSRCPPPPFLCLYSACHYTTTPCLHFSVLGGCRPHTTTCLPAEHPHIFPSCACSLHTWSSASQHPHWLSSKLLGQHSALIPFACTPAPSCRLPHHTAAAPHTPGPRCYHRTHAPPASHCHGRLHAALHATTTALVWWAAGVGQQHCALSCYAAPNRRLLDLLIRYHLRFSPTAQRVWLYHPHLPHAAACPAVAGFCRLVPVVHGFTYTPCLSRVVSCLPVPLPQDPHIHLHPPGTPACAARWPAPLPGATQLLPGRQHPCNTPHLPAPACERPGVLMPFYRRDGFPAFCAFLPFTACPRRRAQAGRAGRGGERVTRAYGSNAGE